MAGDWIKMRVGLVTHPKVLALSEALAENEDYQDWSGMSGFVPALGGTRKEFDDEFSQALRVTRYVTVTALLRFWGYANEHAKDEFISSLRISDIDEIAGIPGFGAALELIGWAVYDGNKRGVSLPNFSEYNATASDRGAADRQKRYREKKKNELNASLAQSSIDDVTRDVTRDVTELHREEKRREENKTLEATPLVSSKLPTCPQNEILELFAEVLPELPQPRVWDGAREKNLRTRWRWVLADLSKKGKPCSDADALDFFRRMFGYIRQSDFLMGRSNDWSCPGLHWIVEAGNFAKIIEGAYENKAAA